MSVGNPTPEERKQIDEAVGFLRFVAKSKDASEHIRHYVEIVLIRLDCLEKMLKESGKP